MAKQPKTYRAKERGYVDGRLIEAGEVFSTTAEKGEWMEPIGQQDATVERAMAAAVDPQPDDVEIDGLSQGALESLAVQNGIDPKGLSKKNLVAAIKGAHDKNRTT